MSNNAYYESDDELRDRCNCEDPEYDIEGYHEEKVKSFLLQIYDLEGEEDFYQQFRSIDAKVPLEVKCEKCLQPETISVLLTARPVWRKERISSDVPPRIDHFEDIEIYLFGFDEPETSLKDCFKASSSAYGEVKEILLVLHAEQDQRVVNEVCTFLEKEPLKRDIICIKILDEDNWLNSRSWIENMALVDFALIVVTRESPLNFMSGIQQILKLENHALGNVSLLSIGRNPAGSKSGRKSAYGVGLQPTTAGTNRWE
ncbi:uncharacterized protein LOC128202841 isoform X2 [Mya arenaria]|uniref:uncharacterized protein LOC128202841 isoform X2 n=1 Tax=Mya arenaria TaxID=6604 RepID=UPI0022E5F235|nr:uncharacterized protein LOC128202841 isoform X2 [Mya arenaria]